MTFRDDDLTWLEAHGVPALPAAIDTAEVETGGARIRYAIFGGGAPVLLLHGGLGNMRNWAYQIPALVAAGYQAIAIDSRGHGKSTRDDQPFSYRLMAADTRAVMDRLGIDKAAIIGWSDGADTGLVMADETPERVCGLFFFACNVDNDGTLPFVLTPVVERIFQQHQKDYAELSPAPDGFDALCEDLGPMQRTQPDYSADDLKRIAAPVMVVLGEHDEFIRREHLEYLAATLPNGRFVLLPEVSHFAPLQRPDVFNQAMLDFLRGL